MINFLDDMRDNIKSGTFYGFDPEKISKMGREFNNAFQDFEDALIGVTQRQFLSEISTQWTCPEAVSYFKLAFKPSFDALNNRAMRLFDDILTTSNDGAQKWARRTGKPCPKITFNVRKVQVDVSCIKERREDGAYGIDVSKSVTTALKLKTKTYSKASAALSKIEGLVSNSGFIGHNQEKEFLNSISRIRESVLDTISVLVTQVNNTVKTTADKYKSTANAVVNDFSELGITVGSAVGQAAGLIASSTVNLVSTLGAPSVNLSSPTSEENLCPTTKYAPPSMFSSPGQNTCPTTKYAPPSMR